ncbi:DUF3945 domain-containing protein [Bacteroides thetaiotaomicron]|uniref:DUF3945 domain-containing protein n=1 Tax=Bacteroides thetaiotaomicron TaxID=818 RepID=UPI001CE291C0|nr:DUF3945 domain-containing protein [Bacteroides thetaiotaomicron]MCA6029972.1 DUF3945 domain-containing protein [Bacteroides thetaiotaomicron]
MAKKKQEQQEQSQDEHVMAVLDKRTNKTAVISKMNEQDGSIEVVPPDKKNSNSFLKLDRTSPLELFFTNFKNQYENPTSFSFFLVPFALLDKTLNAVIQIRKGEDPGLDGKKLVENSELNDEGRIAKLARRYKFDEHQLPWKDLNALGLDKETLFNNHCMGELLKGRITSTALPISKEINGERKDLGEACFMCVKGADGKVELKTLTRLDKPQYDSPAYKGVFTDEEKNKLAETGTLGGIKEMKDTLTGNVCKCYVSFHETTNRVITMPVDAIKIPDYIYGKRLDDKQKQILASGGELPVNDIQRKNDTMLSGVAYVDPTIRDIAFKQSDKQLKVNDTILGAKISPEQKKILENHGMVFIENMRNPKTKQLFSDDVRFSNKSNNLLIGRNAREYKPAVENQKNDKKKETKQTARHVVFSRPQTRKSSLSFS